MNTFAAHAFAPEQIMAFLDGELPTSDAHAVAAHLASCPACATLAQQFRETSTMLSRWTIEPAPPQLEAAIAALGEETVRPTRVEPIRMPSWNWKLWAGSLAAASLVIAFIIVRSTPRNLYLADKASRQETLASLHEGEADRDTGSGLEQLGKGPNTQNGESEQFDRLDRFAKLKAPPVIPPRTLSAPMNQAAFGKLPPNVKSEGLLADTASTPLIARTVSMVVVVKDVPTSRAQLDAILTHHHGYSATLNLNTPESGPRTFNASLRIPAPELAAALAECKSLGRVESETQSGEEVTQQHADLLARLHNSRETEGRLRDILAQRTGKLSDVLEVEESIARVRGEIESMEAEQQTLEHRVDFATVDLQLTELYKARLDAPGDNVSTRLHNALVAGAHNVSNTLLGIVLFFAEYGPSLLLWLAILGTPAWFFWRRHRRTKA